MRKSYGVIVVSLLFILSGFNQPDARSYYETAVNSLNKKDYIQAISDFTNAISLKPDFADAYYHRATAKELLGKKMGFFSSEMCGDLVTALKFGKKEAMSRLERSCMGECFTIESAFEDPESVYCADFSSRNLTSIPTNSNKLVYLVKLNINNNNFTTLDSKIGDLNTIISLDASSNKINNISTFIGKNINLKELNLFDNQLANLPYEFGKLSKLTTLNLRKNRLKSLPKSVAMLKSLETLDLTFNQLTSMPLEIANLKNLKTLLLVGNEIPKGERDKIKALLPRTNVKFE